MLGRSYGAGGLFKARLFGRNLTKPMNWSDRLTSSDASDAVLSDVRQSPSQKLCHTVSPTAPPVGLPEKSAEFLRAWGAQNGDGKAAGG